MILTNVNSDQLQALRNNFETVVISEAEEKGKYDVTIPMENELHLWKLFFAGGDYVMAKFRHKTESLNIKP